MIVQIIAVSASSRGIKARVKGSASSAAGCSDYAYNQDAVSSSEDDGGSQLPVSVPKFSTL